MTLSVGRAVFLLKRSSFNHLNLELVVVEGFSIEFNGQLVGRRCLEQAGDIVGNAHEVDGSRPFVGQLHGGLHLLVSVGAEATRRVGFLNIGFEHIELLLLKGHAAF